jgi:hypothetical protein
MLNNLRIRAGRNEKIRTRIHRAIGVLGRQNRSGTHQQVTALREGTDRGLSGWRAKRDFDNRQSARGQDFAEGSGVLGLVHNYDRHEPK